jgi:hypothetical protein
MINMWRHLYVNCKAVKILEAESGMTVTMGWGLEGRTEEKRLFENDPSHLSFVISLVYGSAGHISDQRLSRC